MKTILFNSNGDPLKIQFKVENGVMAVAYSIKLSEKNSNMAVTTYDGDNQNPEDDIYYLPVPNMDNDERILRLSADFYGLDLELSKNYLIKLEVYQGNTLLDFIDQSGELTSSTLSLLLFAKLKIR
jgi:hypothetical protein